MCAADPPKDPPCEKDARHGQQGRDRHYLNSGTGDLAADPLWIRLWDRNRMGPHWEKCAVCTISRLNGPSIVHTPPRRTLVFTDEKPFFVLLLMSRPRVKFMFVCTLCCPSSSSIPTAVNSMRITGLDLNHKINPLFKQSSHQMALSLW